MELVVLIRDNRCRQNFIVKDFNRSKILDNFRELYIDRYRNNIWDIITEIIHISIPQIPNNVTFFEKIKISINKIF